jgi:hypothetical protein
MYTTFIKKIALQSLLLIIVASCQSHVQNENATFKYVKDTDNDSLKTGAIKKAIPVKEVEYKKIVLKNEIVDEWTLYKIKTEKKIKSNELIIDEIKNGKDIPGNKNKFNRQISRLEQKNNDLRKKMNDYNEEAKAKWEKFKLSMSHDIDAIAIEIQDVSITTKKAG